MSLSVETLRRADSRYYAGLLGLHWYAQWSWMSGAGLGPDPQLPYTHRCYRLGRMRRMCYGRRLRVLGVQPMPLNRWRMPRHPPEQAPALPPAEFAALFDEPQACSRSDAEEVAHFVAHYSRGYFPRQALQTRLAELEQGRYHFSPDERWEKPFRMAALRYLLSQPGHQLTLFA